MTDLIFVENPKYACKDKNDPSFAFTMKTYLNFFGITSTIRN